ncbi:nitrilase and fragile histidine triad fusion protein NitFhit isoform X1 [Euwallacea fornicatus]|uniref:nitrilase and fragile histidine triad fusion protein NitFhit isoform X1 n=2 Tax=Euwallacea fornicatus TaxID=995702 RepID=UPI0033901CED
MLKSTFTHSPSILYHICRMATKCTVSVIQFTATNNKEDNFNSVKRLVGKAVDQNAKMVFLPEACDFISRDKSEFKKLSEPISGPLIKLYQDLAKTYGIWLSIGGFHEKFDENTIYNSHIIFDNNGDIRGIYRKIHLFDVSIPDKNIHLRESDNNIGGAQIVPPFQSPVGQLGLSICYDLRFPEQSTILRKLGADVLTFPSAFTSGTGKVHWEPLLKARAIENQCYVIAAAQYGKHNEKRTSFGQSLIVDPWGQVVAECPKYSEEIDSNESIGIATIDLDLVEKVRAEMPVFYHRRNDIYSLNLIGCCQEIDDNHIYSFGDKNIPGKTVFYISKYCYAFTNIRCVVPGHVLISTLRVAKRLQDLSEEEISDLFQTTIKVAKVMESVHNSPSSTICVQDGKFAGQTVPHVHVHVLPRKQGDFANNDDIYLHLARHDNERNVNALRSQEEQIEEASILRTHFY